MAGLGRIPVTPQWCPQIDLVIAGQPVSLLLAEGVWDTNTIGPSADNIAVVFGGEVSAPWGKQTP